MPYPYDWRKSLERQAKNLAATIATDLDETEQSKLPIRIVAHSMGGLLARAMIAYHGKTWERIAKRKGSRLVMLGTPTGGSYSILRALLGRERLVQLLALVDFKNSKSDILRIISGFPGILEMLPDDDRKLFEMKSWENLAAEYGRGWQLPDEQTLDAAARVHRKIRSSPIDPSRMVYVAGVAPATPIAFEIDENAHGRKRIRIKATSRGDGRVPWATGIPAHIPTWYMPAEHGELAAHRESLPAIEELLIKGTTTKLARTPPVTDRGAAEEFELLDDESVVYPDVDDIQAAAAGFSRQARAVASSERLTVAIRHDDVAFARYLVLVGHHLDDGIFGAEEALNRRLDRRLENARSLGLYPGKIGECEIFLDRKHCSSAEKCRGAIVIGLGPAGELLPTRLERSVVQGVLRYAVEPSEKEAFKQDRKVRPRADETIKAYLSSLVIGSAFGGLSHGDSIRANLQGVLQANRELAAANLPIPVRICGVEFVDLFESRATATVMSVRRMRDEPHLGARIEVKGEIIHGSAGRRQVPIDEESSWWHRLRIARRSETDHSLSFTTMTGRARAEDRLLPLQQVDVDRFLEKAVSSTRWNERVANTLFHLLLPNDLKQLSNDRGNLVLVLDSNAARYPWELLHDRSSGERRPMVTSSGLIRQLITEDFRQNVEQAVAAKALVVGDPPSDLPELPGAKIEAEHAVRCLRDAGLEVRNPEIRTSADSILSALYADDYQILHLAGHGVFRHKINPEKRKSGKRDADGPNFDLPDRGQGDAGPGDGCQPASANETEEVSGMVVGEGRYLTPALVEQMPRVPEFVFINCCHLGREDGKRPPRRDYHLLAENLGTRFIKMGVRAVIAAGWAVDDLAAQTFAAEFYRKFLRGEEFGRAVQYAREQTFDKHKGVNTWGAYQCYGHPNFRLRLRGERPMGRTDVAEFVSQTHAVLEIEGIRVQAKVQEGTRDALQDRLDRTVKSLNHGWLRSSASLNEAIGAAAAELRNFDQAMEYYQIALECESADVSLKAAEQLANMRVRKASALAKDKSGRRSAVKMIQKSIRELNQLLALGHTAERYNLLGSACRRLFMLTNREPDLDKMAENYRKGHELFRKQGNANLAYPLTNWLTARLGRMDPTVDLNLDTVEELLNEAIERFREVESPDIWTAFMEHDCEVIRCLYAGNLHQKAAALADRYQEVVQRTGSPREIDSVVGGLEFQKIVLERLKTGTATERKNRHRSVKALDQVIAALRGVK